MGDFKCSIYKRGFAAKGSLTRHVKIVTRWKPLNAPFAQKKFQAIKTCLLTQSSTWKLKTLNAWFVQSLTKEAYPWMCMSKPIMKTWEISTVPFVQHPLAWTKSFNITSRPFTKKRLTSSVRCAQNLSHQRPTSQLTWKEFTKKWKITLVPFVQNCIIRNSIWVFIFRLFI